MSSDTLVYMPGGRAPVWVQGSVQCVLVIWMLGVRVAFCLISSVYEVVESVGRLRVTVKVRG